MRTNLSKIVPVVLVGLAVALIGHAVISIVMDEEPIPLSDLAQVSVYYIGWATWCVVAAVRWRRGKGRVAALTLLIALTSCCGLGAGLIYAIAGSDFAGFFDGWLAALHFLFIGVLLAAWLVIAPAVLLEFWDEERSAGRPGGHAP